MRQCWPRSSAGLCGWLGNGDSRTVDERKPLAQAFRKRFHDCSTRLVPEGREQQQRGADHKGRQRDVQLDRAELKVLKSARQPQPKVKSA